MILLIFQNVENKVLVAFQQIFSIQETEYTEYTHCRADHSWSGVRLSAWINCDLTGKWYQKLSISSNTSVWSWTCNLYVSRPISFTTRLASPHQTLTKMSMFLWYHAQIPCYLINVPVGSWNHLSQPDGGTIWSDIWMALPRIYSHIAFWNPTYTVNRIQDDSGPRKKNGALALWLLCIEKHIRFCLKSLYIHR